MRRSSLTFWISLWLAGTVAVTALAVGREILVERHSGRLVAIKREPAEWGTKETNSQHFVLVVLRSTDLLIKARNRLKAIGKPTGGTVNWPYVNPFCVTNAAGETIEDMRINVVAATNEMALYGEIKTTNCWYRSGSAHK